MINQSACKHLILKPDLEVAMVLRFEFYLREAITACRQCGAFYLIKARDFSEKSVLYDVSKLPPRIRSKPSSRSAAAPAALIALTMNSRSSSHTGLIANIWSYLKTENSQ